MILLLLESMSFVYLMFFVWWFLYTQKITPSLNNFIWWKCTFGQGYLYMKMMILCSCEITWSHLFILSNSTVIVTTFWCLWHVQIETFRERRALALTLNDTKTAVNTLHQVVDVAVVIIIIIIGLLILGIATTHILVFISSQLLLVVFIFGNTCKTVFEAIIFLFVMHPYDVGDRCEIEGVQVNSKLALVLFHQIQFWLLSKHINVADGCGRDEYLNDRVSAIW